MSHRSFVAVIVSFIAAFLASSPALAGPRKPRVLLVESFNNVIRTNDVKNKIFSSGLFDAVDSFDGRIATPTIAALRAYDAVMVSNDSPWVDRTALGNVLKQYVDEGYGVVQTTFTVNGITNSNLGGSWTGDYNCITFSSATTGAATLGTIAQPNHPIVNGVSVFNGGSDSFRPLGTAITAGATLVASWSDGKPLVVVGPRLNRADLGFFPPSSDSTSSFWSSSTDGVKLMANALMYVIRPKILIVHSFFTPGSDADVVAKLRSTEQFSAIDTFNASFNTGSDAPTLEQLKKYDAVMVSNGTFWKNRDALGNVIADYTDWGGGVVLTTFTTAGTGNSDLGGRFAGDYRIIAFGGSTSGNATLGTIAYAEHPIVAGVASFDGGARSARPFGTALAPGGLVVASWSDGKILAATSTRRHNRADLGLYPPSNAVQPDGWLASTDGAKLMANALVYTIKPYVGLADSQFAPTPENTKARLLASRRFSGVTRLPALSSSTPTTATLLPFGTVLCSSDVNYLDANALGNNLADYIDAGGSVVGAVFAVTANGGLANSRPRGRWITQGYDITPEGSTGGSIANPASLGSFVGPAHPVQTFVRRFTSGSFSFRQGNNPLVRGRRLMEWSDGKMLASLHSFRRRVDLGFWPASSAESPNSWNVRTDGTTIIANALHFAAFMKPCPGDLNGDGAVDDSDFQLFAGYYDTLLDPRGDLTGDNNSDDADFQVFAQAYNELLCP
ncbi:MAG: hypothetical protein K2Y21_01570 [Phycisphaerales bacterium]|nr:hypothetical protein [Phycisphaerales bacterium]